MPCQKCGAPTRIQVQCTISAPEELAHRFSKSNLRRKDADYICTNPGCGTVVNGYGNYVTRLREALQGMVDLWEKVHPGVVLGRPALNAAKQALKGE